MKFRSIISLILFTSVALLSYSIWAFGSSLFASEPLMYAACAIAFLSLGGISLLPENKELSSSNLRFCLGFAAAFSVYAVLWSVAWFSLPSTFGEILGSSAGILGFVAVFRSITKQQVSLQIAIATIFLWHTLGYYTGGFLYAAIQGQGPGAMDLDWSPLAIRHTARMTWGLCYGLGFGAGIIRFLHLSRQS